MSQTVAEKPKAKRKHNLPPKPPVAVKFMRPREFAQRISTNWRTVYGWLDKGILPGYKFSGVVLIDVDEADRILKGLPK